MDRLTTPHPGGTDMLGMPLIGTYDVDMTPGYPAARVKCTLGRYEDTGLTPEGVEGLKTESARLRAELEAAKRVIDEHHISLLQYMSLRHNFHSLVEAVMGEDYYNLGCDVYTCDYFCCEDLAFAAKKGRKIVKRFKKLADWDAFTTTIFSKRGVTEDGGANETD